MTFKDMYFVYDDDETSGFICSDCGKNHDHDDEALNCCNE